MQLNNRDALPLHHIMEFVSRHCTQAHPTVTVSAKRLFSEYRDWQAARNEKHDVSLRQWQIILKTQWQIQTQAVRGAANAPQTRQFVLSKVNVTRTVRAVTNNAEFVLPPPTE
jgi:hypothetical protein